MLFALSFLLALVQSFSPLIALDHGGNELRSPDADGNLTQRHVDRPGGTAVTFDLPLARESQQKLAS